MTLNAGAFQPADGPIPLPPGFHWLPEFAPADRKRHGEKGSGVGPTMDGMGGQLLQWVSKSQTAQDTNTRPIAQLNDRKRQPCLSALPIPAPSTVHV